MKIETEAQLRQIYGEPVDRVKRKQLAALEQHSVRFIEMAPFVVLASTNGRGFCDSSPRGGAPGFVKIIDNHTLLIPDARGNNLLDSHINILETGRIGCLFMIPGMDEVLRVNGRAEIRTDSDYLGRFAHPKHPAVSVIKVAIEEVFLHCAKALMRAGLWQAGSQIDRREFPSLGQMVNDQPGEQVAVESQAEMAERYRKLLSD
ncbi:pyridoxamine 5'-phosphate oxidase family protein [Marinobacterium jannaschii]|uniref:pyridoxamine 5'-phosphate oxidase family protein n=1 Tax=Marinobacterium jannaschii TaxID=64970 RepID=UPI000485393D|nr:pyridoxamine 5'-phosphate oxidase family protein [Marinobacterium jannaschii]